MLTPEMFDQAREPGVGRAPVMVACGLGVNSVALLCGLKEHGFRPDAVLFADTAGEKPETYAYLPLLQAWLAAVGFPELVRVANAGKYAGLEDNCRKKMMLPSIAYGRKACSEKYKQRPQHQWAKRWPPAARWWDLDAGGRRRFQREARYVVKLLGYDASEPHRGDVRSDGFYTYEHPLKDWGWDRAACLAAVGRAGLPPPPKSACFFCPSSKKAEVRWLMEHHPDLFERGLEMERDGMTTVTSGSVKGLGRWWSWAEFQAAEAQKIPLKVSDPADYGCVCQGEVYEGDGVDADGPDADDACTTEGGPP